MVVVRVCQSVYVGGWVGEEKEIILRKHIVRTGERNAQWFYTYAVPIRHCLTHTPGRLIQPKPVAF